MEGARVTGMYYDLCWFGVILSIGLLVVGLWNAALLASEKRILCIRIYSASKEESLGSLIFYFRINVLQSSVYMLLSLFK